MSIYVRMRNGNDTKIVPLRKASSLRGYHCIGIEPGDSTMPHQIIAEQIEHCMDRAYAAEGEREAMRPVVEAATALYRQPQDQRNTARFREVMATYLGKDQS